VLDNTLELDIGNSRVKWRTLSGECGITQNNELSIFCEKDFGALKRIKIASVANDKIKLQISSALEKKYQIKPELAVSQLGCAGFVNKYENPNSLGVDRWLACLAAWMESGKKAVLVVDAGSAITIDTVNERSEFVGGYIIPGLEMMQAALVGDTGQIVCDIATRFRSDCDLLPLSTQEAVQRGACFAALAAVERAVRLFLQQWPSGRVFFTGGAGLELARAVAMEETYRPDLVLDGLAIALP
jgi:type III pantothenate kinase